MNCVLPPFEEVIFNEKRICCEVWKTYREQVHNSLKEIPQANAILLDWIISNTSTVILEQCNDYQTKAEKLAQQKVVKQEPRNQVSKTLIQCSETFIKL